MLSQTCFGTMHLPPDLVQAGANGVLKVNVTVSSSSAVTVSRYSKPPSDLLLQLEREDDVRQP